MTAVCAKRTAGVDVELPLRGDGERLKWDGMRAKTCATLRSPVSAARVVCVAAIPQTGVKSTMVAPSARRKFDHQR